jgi:hypothetical protein
MKNIKFDGVEVTDDLKGKITGKGEITILKISSEGMLFEASFRMTMNRRCTFQISMGRNSVTLTAKVVSVLMKNPDRTATAVEFVNLADKEKVFVHKVIEKSIEEKMPEIQNSTSEIRKSKFRSSE